MAQQAANGVGGREKPVGNYRFLAEQMSQTSNAVRTLDQIIPVGCNWEACL